MCDERGDQEANPNPKDKWWHKVTTLQRRIAEVVFLALFFAWDGLEKWPVDHAEALIFGVIGTSAVLATEVPFKKWVWATLGLSGVAAVIYWIAGPEAGVVIIGELQPGEIPRPHITCGREPIPDDMGVIMTAGSVYLTKFHGTIPLIARKTGPILSARFSGDGIAIDASIYDATGNAIATIKNNKFRVLEGREAHLKLTGLSQITVTDENRQVVLDVQYANANTIHLSGIFEAHGRPISVTDQGLTNGRVTIAGSCFKDIGFLQLP